MENDRKGIVKGLSKAYLVAGVFFAGAGVVFILLAFFGNYTLSFHRVVLPQWVFYTVAVLALLFGLGGVREAFRAVKCGSCGMVLAYAESVFPRTSEGEVLRAWESLDPSPITGLATSTSREEWVRLSLDYCTGCGTVGALAVQYENRNREKRFLGRPREVHTETVAAFLPLLTQMPRLDRLDVEDIQARL